MKMLTKLGLCAVVLAWIGACDSGGSSTDGNTSWLTQCDEAAPCAAGLTCACGLCTKSCDDESACAGLRSGAACVTPALLGSACARGPAPTGPVCMGLCVSAADCAAGLSCKGGFCAAPSNEDAGAGGGSASGGTGGGASGGNTGSGGIVSAAGGASNDGSVDQNDASAADGRTSFDGGADANATTGGARSTDSGTPDSAVPPEIGDGGTAVITSIAAGPYHACALVNGGVQCWGRNDAKQLGNVFVGSNSASPVTVEGLGCEVSSVCAGLHHTCALVNGAVKCWGGNDEGQLGTGAASDATAAPASVPNLALVDAIACGRNHTCALSGNSVSCWGDDSLDQLGTTGATARGPVTVPNLASGVTAIYANGGNTCAIVNGGLACWGDDTWGQLGNGVSGVSAFVPYEPPGLASGVTAVAIAGEFICALVNGAVQCSGRTFYDVDASTWTEKHTFTPLSKPFDVGVQSISGGYEFGCASLSGAAYCWGAGTVAHFTAGPNIVGLETGVTSVVTGDYYACALENGAPWCWGWDMDGQLGRGVVGVGGYAQPVVDLVATPTCPYGHCFDHAQDDGETAVDCGGTCKACSLGESCAADGDCTSNACDSSSRKCVSFYCNDHHRDRDETDADCGGATCGACATGRTCADGFDCATSVCSLPAHVCE